MIFIDTRLKLNPLWKQDVFNIRSSSEKETVIRARTKRVSNPGSWFLGHHYPIVVTTVYWRLSIGSSFSDDVFSVNQFHLLYKWVISILSEWWRDRRKSFLTKGILSVETINVGSVSILFGPRHPFGKTEVGVMKFLT